MDVYFHSLILMAIGSLCSGMSFGGSPDGVLGTLCFWRFVMGLGGGAIYPVTAVIASECASTLRRGTMVALVFAAQGFGYLVACAVVMAVSAALRPDADGGAGCSGFHGGHCYPMAAAGRTLDEARGAVWAMHAGALRPTDDFAWRLVLSLGALPALLCLCLLRGMPEPARFTALVQGHVQQAAQDMDRALGRSDLSADDPADPAAGPESFEDGARRSALAALLRSPATAREFLASRNPGFAAQLAGCAGAWFFLDVAFYSQGLFQKDVFASIGFIPSARDMSALGEMDRIARAQAVTALASTVPGLLATAYTVDYVGRRPLQLMGFCFMTALMALLSGFYAALLAGAVPSFIAMYVLTFFVANFGPNATTYILPAELFPARLRCTCHGFCAALGKLGAVVGATGFLYASQPPSASPPGIGLQPALGILAATNFLGLVVSAVLTPETNGQGLEALCAPKEEERADAAPTRPVVVRA